MSMVRCSKCERPFDSDREESRFINNKVICKNCEPSTEDLVCELKLWISKNSFTDIGNKDHPKGPDLECIYVDELLKKLEDLK